MKSKIVWALLFVFSLQNVATAQEYAGNWWVNPQTRQVEGIGANNALPRSSGGSEGEGSWVEVATDASGDRWLAKFLRIRQFGSRNPGVIFLVVYVRFVVQWLERIQANIQQIAPLGDWSGFQIPRLKRALLYRLYPIRSGECYTTGRANSLCKICIN